MRAREFIKENASAGATASGNFAVAETDSPLPMLRRNPVTFENGKYANSLKSSVLRKNRALGQSKNTISN